MEQLRGPLSLHINTTKAVCLSYEELFSTLIVTCRMSHCVQKLLGHGPSDGIK